MSLPAVFVTIEDRSFALPSIPTGRSGFIVITGDRGPHNQVIELTSRQQFHKLFGRPDFDRTGQGHYMADKFLQFSNRLFVIRAVLLTSLTEASNAGLANAAVKFNNPTGSSQVITGNYNFINEIDAADAGAGPGLLGANIQIAARAIITDKTGFETFNIGDWIYAPADSSTDAIQISSKSIIGSGPDYQLVSLTSYAATSTDTTLAGGDGTFDRTGVLTVIANGFENANEFFPGVSPVVGGTYTFINASTSVTAFDQASFDAVNEEQFIFPDVWLSVPVFTGSGLNDITISGTYTGTSDLNYVVRIDAASAPDTFEWSNDGGATFPNTGVVVTGTAQLLENGVSVTFAATTGHILTEFWSFTAHFADSSLAQQIITKTSTGFILTLDSVFTGTTTPAPIGAKAYTPFEIVTDVNIRSTSAVDLTDSDNVFHFVAKGTGSFYNDVFIIGTRNIGLEKLFVDANGDPKFKFAFIDITIKKQNKDGTTEILEGPFSTSLINKTDLGEIVRDINTGEELFLPSIINRRSEFVEVFEAAGSTILEGTSVAAEKLRLQALTLFVSGTITGLSTRGFEGFLLQNGEDGVQYDSNNRLQLSNGEIQGLLVLAYNGGLTSVDGSIELIVQDVYPWFEFDYIITGGYNQVIQKAGKDLADLRNDALVLADTGSKKLSADEDLTARLNDVPWNTFNAMLYVQYREIFDPFTGKNLFFSPVIHAIERHLLTDQNFWIAEPVAGIEKGAIEEPIKLAYRPPLVKMSDLIDQEMNPVIVEPDGKYIISQFTTWKRLSVMKRAHVVKFVHFVKKQLPKLLKDILQRKATQFWIGQAEQRVNGFMNQYLENSTSDIFAAIKSFNADVEFDEARSELNIALTMNPIRAIEAIHVNIIVT